MQLKFPKDSKSLKKFHKILFWQILLLTALFVFFGGKKYRSFKAKADDFTEITQLSNVSTDLKTPLDSIYSFTPQLSPNSKVTVNDFSGAVIERLPDQTYQLTSNSSKQIKGQVIYSNIGLNVKGDALDAVVTITAHDTEKMIIAPVGSVALTGKNASAQMKMRFVIHGTMTPEAMSGHLTVGELTSNQRVGFNLNQTKQIFTFAETKVKFSKSNNMTDFLVAEKSKQNDFTMVFDRQMELDYALKNQNDKAQVIFNKNAVVDFKMPDAIMTGVDETVNLRKLNETSPIENLTQSENDQTEAPEGKIIHPLYVIQQTVPKGQFGYLGWYQIDDDLNSAWLVKPENIKITNELKENVTNLFQVMIENNHLTIDATQKALQNPEFFGHTYFISINGRLDSEHQPSVDSNQESIEFSAPNNAKVTMKIAGKTITKSTNSATNKVKAALPKVTLDQSSIYPGMTHFSGETSDTDQLKLNITYKDYAGKVHEQEPLNVTYYNNLSNDLTANNDENKHNWQAEMPSNLDPKASSVKLTAKDSSGMSKDYLLKDGTWWDYDATSKVLTIHPHELNYDLDSVNNGTATTPSYVWPWSRKPINACYYATKVVIEPGVTAKGSLKKLFESFSVLTTIEGLENVDTSQVTDMNSMFRGCYKLSSLDLSHFDTSQVTDMSFMFTSNYAQTSLDVSKFDTSKVKDMSYMFGSLTGLTTLDITNFNTEKVTNMESMFSGSSKLTNLDLSSFNTSLVTNMTRMFFQCTALTSLNFTNFDTSQVTDMSYMFQYCGLKDYECLNHLNTSNVTTMDFMFAYTSIGDFDFNKAPNFDTSKVTTMKSMFQNSTISSFDGISQLNTGNVESMDNMFSSSKLTTVGTNTWDTGKVKNMYAMFKDCKSLVSVDSGNWDTSSATLMFYMFSGCTNLTTVNTSLWNTGNVTNMQNMFEKCSSLVSVDVSKWDVSNCGSFNYMFFNCSSLPTLDVSNWNTSKSVIMSYMFSGCAILNNLDTSKWTTGMVTNMTYMFNDCKALSALDVSNWDTSQVTNMSYMFNNDSNLGGILDTKNWNVDKVTNLSYTFNKCSSLTGLDVSNWNPKAATNMNSTFAGCKLVPVIDVSGWSTGLVTDMSSMFSGCETVTALNCSSFDTRKVTAMISMFEMCTNLTSLDLKGALFDTSNVVYMRRMFRSCPSLVSLDLSHFSTPKLHSVNQMFSQCASLKSIKFGSGFDTSQVGAYDPGKSENDMSFLFDGCKSLTTLDLSFLDTTNSRLGYIGMRRMLSDMTSLWKITLGPKTQLFEPTNWGGINYGNGLDNPTAGTLINDPADPTGEYYCKGAKWQEVGTGSDHEPNGAEKTVTDIFKDSQAAHTESRTYVWYQTGQLNFTAPTEIDLGTHSAPSSQKDYQSTAQSMDVSDNRNLRGGKQWQVTVEATDLVKTDDAAKKISGNPLYVKDALGEHQLTSTATSLYMETSTGVGYSDEWAKSWNLMFKSSPNAIPEAGTYKGTVTFTLIDTTP
ncbi:BspA family leucine-rich repeat surface protein [Xylocopilactobacillus apis]|uniref:Surface protein n=1 Tax=Xylocopilactobacillus apis TaxID=2932183 RepID=A0AAU9CT62_9LACO|nr:BspA family leucine-rich repeat surface protein [Xylocopilactobacillus apis]BDR57194.1 hypothetical protein KIMC2_17560 [Xylocopilactobacillus apis]